MAKENLKITIGIPTKGWCDSSFAYGYGEIMVATLAHGHEVQPIFSVGSLIDVGRNRIVAKMMGDYLFFLDDDTLPPAEVIIKLLVHKKDIVTALYFNRQAPYQPQIYLKNKENSERYDAIQDYQGLMEVDGCGLGACLIKKTVFDKLVKPYFSVKLSPETGERLMGEDFGFCRAAQDAGFKIYADTDIICGHIARDVVNETHWEGSKRRLAHIKEQMGEEKFNKWKKEFRDN